MGFEWIRVKGLRFECVDLSTMPPKQKGLYSKLNTDMKIDFKYSELTHKIIGCAMKVYNTLGNGFQEKIYQRALAIEMTKQDLKCTQEFEMRIYYESILLGTRRVDFLLKKKLWWS